MLQQHPQTYGRQMLCRSQAEGRMVLLATQHGGIMGEPREKFGFSSLPCENFHVHACGQAGLQAKSAQKTKPLKRTSNGMRYLRI